MSKQDRQGARTPADLERRYNWGKTFAELLGFTEEAKTAAENAANATNDLDKKLGQEEIFNRLTNNGEVQGIYRDENGEVYINASFIKGGTMLADLIRGGVLTSSDGTVTIDLGNNKVTVKTLISGRKGKIELAADGIYGYGWDATSESYYKTLRLDPGGKNSEDTEEFTMITSEDSSAGLAVSSSKSGTPTIIGNPGGESWIRGNVIKVGEKTVEWKDNGDGTFTMIGR